MRKLADTKFRLELLQYLRDGGWLASHIGGWYDKRNKGSGVLIRVETQDWLEATGELVEIKRNGRYVSTTRIYHKDKVPEQFKKAQGSHGDEKNVS